MALVRVYCGLAAANVPSWLSVAVVDDAGRLLDLCELSDDPAGYARLGALLAQRSGGSAPVAADRGDHLLAQLLAAANRPIAIADPDSVADFAERFCDDESPDERESPAPQRRAVGLARALQAGALSAVAQSPAWDLDEFKPVLAAHAAVTAGRQAAAAALREVLRELYPAALRAYPDPAEHVPLKILDALPEPGLLTSSPSARSRDAALIAELSATGVADTTSAVSAITALRVAVQESPRRNTHRMLGPVVAETVRQAVAAVRACDAASAALVATLVERLGPASTAVPQRPHLVSVAAESPAPRRPAGPAAEVPLSRMAPRERTPSAAAAGVGAGVSPAPPVPLAPAGPQMPQMPMMPEAPAAMTPDYLSGLPAPRPAAGPAPRSRSHWPLEPRVDDGLATAGNLGGTFGSLRPDPASHAGSLRPDPASHAGSPRQHDDSSSSWPAGVDPLTAPFERREPLAPVSPGRVPPPWLADDMPMEPPSLRLVEASRPAGAPMGDPLTDPLPPDPFDGLRFEPPVLRVIDGDGGRNRRTGGAEHAGAATAEPDGDLLIFGQMRSAWFTEVDESKLADDDTQSWGRLSDEGWHAAEQLARPAVGADTLAGLPRRVPQANLVPGAPLPPPRQLRIVRDAESIAAHTTGYFRGWRRGQEVGGFPVGQRDRAAWEFNRDQRARETGGIPEQRARLS